MKYLTAKQYSKIWGITERRIIKLCNEGRINGALKNGMVWEIPEETLKPSDRRSNIYKYINVPKNIIIVNAYEEVKQYLYNLLDKGGYLVDFKTNIELEDNLNCIEKYYEGIIYFPINNFDKKEEQLVFELANRLNSESSIVIVDYKRTNRIQFEKKFADTLKDNIGCRINTLLLDISNNINSVIDYEQIACDIYKLLTDFKNSTANVLVTDGGQIEFNEYDRTPGLTVGKFYKLINSYFKRLNKEEYLWCASIMMEDEWTESPQEMKFRLINLDVANRGVNVERIFIFKKDKIKEFKDNKTLKIYMQSNIKTLYVDYEELEEKEPQLLEIVGNGWDGINKETLIVDLAGNTKERGYISKNSKEVLKAYNCFQKLKEYSKELKEVLK